MDVKKLNSILTMWNRNHRIEDRREYDVLDIMQAEALTKEEAQWLWVELRMRYFEGIEIINALFRNKPPPFTCEKCGGEIAGELTKCPKCGS